MLCVPVEVGEGRTERLSVLLSVARDLLGVMESERETLAVRLGEEPGESVAVALLEREAERAGVAGCERVAVTLGVGALPLLGVVLGVVVGERTVGEEEAVEGAEEVALGERFELLEVSDGVGSTKPSEPLVEGVAALEGLALELAVELLVAVLEAWESPTRARRDASSSANRGQGGGERQARAAGIMRGEGAASEGARKRVVLLEAVS